MRELTDEEILAVWNSVTDFTDGWEEAIREFIERVEEVQALADAADQGLYDELKEKILELRDEIEETVERAREGEITIEDLENAFRAYGEALGEFENRLLDLEFGTDDDYQDYYDEEPEY